MRLSPRAAADIANLLSEAPLPGLRGRGRGNDRGPVMHKNICYSLATAMLTDILTKIAEALGRRRGRRVHAVCKLP